MKLLHLANDFKLPDTPALSLSREVVSKSHPRFIQEEPRRTPAIALLILLVFAAVSLTIPLHPTRSAVPNGCSTAVALPPGESAATCMLQATNPAKPSGKYAPLSYTPTSYLVSSQVISVQLARIMFARVVNNDLLA